MAEGAHNSKSHNQAQSLIYPPNKQILSLHLKICFPKNPTWDPNK